MKEVLRLPGLVDVHVHFREPGATQKEDFETGTKAAVAGGYTTVIDMPNNPEPTDSPLALQRKILLANNRIYCDVGFHFGATAKSSQYFEDLAGQVFGLKLYMNQTTGPLLVEKAEDLEAIFVKTPPNKLIMVHVEGETLLKSIALAKKHKRRLHVCHVSQQREIKLIKSLKEAGMPITCEVTAHHLFLTEQDVKHLGSYGLMRPPIATEQDRQALWDNLDVIDIVASDHAPHTKDEKLNSEKPPFGVPGIETTLPLMLTAVAEGRLSLERLVELTSTNPRLIFQIEETPDTYTEVDLTHSYVIDSKSLNTKAGWTPFEGMRVVGKVARVVLRGQIVFDGENVQQPTTGRVVYPKR